MLNNRDREVFRRLGLTTMDLAERIGKTRQTVSKGIRDEERDYLQIDDIMKVRQSFLNDKNEAGAQETTEILVELFELGELFNLRQNGLRSKDILKLKFSEAWVVCSNPAEFAHDYRKLYDDLLELMTVANALTVFFVSPWSDCSTFWRKLKRFRNLRAKVPGGMKDTVKPVVSSCHFVDVSSFLLILNPGSNTNRACYTLSDDLEPDGTPELRRLPTRQAARIVENIQRFGFDAAMDSSVEDKRLDYIHATASKQKLRTFEEWSSESAIAVEG